MANCRFVLENSETEDWRLFHRDVDWDYVHMRTMGPCFTDFQAMVHKVFEHLTPGGWIELQDSDWEIHSDDGSAEGTGLQRFFAAVCASAAANGRDLLKAR
jgi:hypothetical protein